MKTEIPFSPPIFQYGTISEYLADSLSEKKQRNPRFSLRAWARQLGYRNPSHISDVLRGKRPVSLPLGTKIQSQMELNEAEHRYFELLVLKSQSRKKEEIRVYDNLLSMFKVQPAEREEDIDYYRSIADWYHSAILEMVTLKGFKNEPAYIAKRLGGNVMIATVKEAVDRLIGLGLLTLNSDRTLTRTYELFHGGNKKRVPSEALKRHHRQMIEKALDSIENQDIGERHLYGTSLAIHKEKYSDAVALIENFHRQILKLTAKQDAAEVYRLNTQFFKLTLNSKESEKGKTHD